MALFPADTVYGLATEPDSRDGVYRLYRLKGRSDRALQDYDAAIALNPKWVNAYFGRAAALQQ